MWMLEIIIRNFQLLHVINLYNLKDKKDFQKILESCRFHTRLLYDYNQQKKKETSNC